MNWAELTKEQKQMAVLAGVIGITVLVALYLFVLKPVLANADTAREQLVRLRADIAKADSALKKEHRFVWETAELKDRIDHATRKYIPPYGNSLAWATERLYAVARAVGVNIESLSGNSAVWGGSSDPAQKGRRAFVSFSAQVALQCSYAELQGFLQALEQDNPLACATGVTLEGREQDPVKHHVNLAVEWPSWLRSPLPPAAPAAPNKAVPAPSGGKPGDRRKAA